MRPRSFDPLRPLDRPVRVRPAWAGEAWGAAQLQRLVVLGRRGARASLPSGVVLVADALLDDPAADEALDWLHATGHDALTLDFDSLGAAADSRASRLAGLVKQLRRRGFWVHGRFTLGQDHDDPGCFERLVAWVEAAGLVGVELRLWTPEPGGATVRDLAREDRVRHRALDRWDGAHVVIAPKQMSAQTLYRGWAWARRHLASPASLWRRRPRERAAWLGYLRELLRCRLGLLHERLAGDPRPTHESSRQAGLAG